MKAILVVASLGALILSGCARRAEPVARLDLPVGDSSRGRQAFIELDCIRCHRVLGANLPEPEVRRMGILLTAEPGGVKNYVRLVNAIIHPPPAPDWSKGTPAIKEIIRPRMPLVNERMTVQQLIDLISFLGPGAPRGE